MREEIVEVIVELSDLLRSREYSSIPSETKTELIKTVDNTHFWKQYRTYKKQHMSPDNRIIMYGEYVDSVRNMFDLYIRNGDVRKEIQERMMNRRGKKG